MKISNVSKKAFISRAFVEHNGSNLTNASFRWCPDAIIPKGTTGRLMVGLGNSNINVTAGLFPSSMELGLAAMLMYSDGVTHFSEEMPVSQNEPINIELDIDPKTSKVVMWVNDKGYDMGVLPGFKGGATKVHWCIAGHGGVKMPAGKLMDCVVATSDGWKAPVFLDEHFADHELDDDHKVEVAGSNHIAIGNQSSLV